MRKKETAQEAFLGEKKLEKHQKINEVRIKVRDQVYSQKKFVCEQRQKLFNSGSFIFESFFVGKQLKVSFADFKKYALVDFAGKISLLHPCVLTNFLKSMQN